MHPAFSRRTFLKTSLAAGVIAQWNLRIRAAEPRAGIPYRVLGQTKEQVSAIGIGGFHIAL
jgi:hypothetical protein